MARHRPAGSDNERRLWLALVLTVAFLLVELVGGLLSGSLALLADAGHMFTDALSLGLALGAFHLARRPPDARRSYGYHRFEVLAAWVNGMALLGVAAWVVFEALQRMLAPRPVLGGTMLAVAVAGFAVNLLVFRILHGADREQVNVRGALLHVLGDLLGSAAAIGAALVILWTGWTPIDPLLSLVVAVLIVRSAWALVRQATHILLEGAPEELDVEALGARLAAATPGLEQVHHVHAWLLSSGRPLVTLHARLRAGADGQVALAAMKRALEAQGFGHSVVQVEWGSCPDLSPEPVRRAPRAGRLSDSCHH